jgi:hypothetical protein
MPPKFQETLLSTTKHEGNRNAKLNKYVILMYSGKKEGKQRRFMTQTSQNHKKHNRKYVKTEITSNRLM